MTAKFALFLCLFLCACTPGLPPGELVHRPAQRLAPPPSGHPLIGSWAGERRDHMVYNWVSHYKADGRKIFLSTNPGGGRQVEESRWSPTADGWQTLTTQVNGHYTDPDLVYYQDSYRILSRSKDRIRYQHTRKGTIYEAWRVAPDYLPSPLP